MVNKYNVIKGLDLIVSILICWGVDKAMELRCKKHALSKKLGLGASLLPS